MMVMSDSAPQNEPDATELLARISGGDRDAVEDLLPLVYAELRSRAGAYFRGQPSNHTLQPTALVHEAYLKLVRNPGGGWNSRAHFCAVAAAAMRQVLVNHAKRRALAREDRANRGAAATSIATPSSDSTIDVLDLDEALTRLGALEPEHVRLIEVRFFGGLTVEETADVLGKSVSTIKREWRRLRAWLRRELTEGASSETRRATQNGVEPLRPGL